MQNIITIAQYLLSIAGYGIALYFYMLYKQQSRLSKHHLDLANLMQKMYTRLKNRTKDLIP